MTRPTDRENGGTSSAGRAPFDGMGPEPLCGSSHSLTEIAGELVAWGAWVNSQKTRAAQLAVADELEGVG